MSRKIYISPSNQAYNTYATGKTNEKEQGELIERWKTEGYRFGTLDELTK